jgi:hypothetical protein
MDTKLLQLERVLRAWDDLEQVEKLHVGFLFRHQSQTAANVVSEQHGSSPRVQALFEEISGLDIGYKFK